MVASNPRRRHVGNGLMVAMPRRSQILRPGRRCKAWTTPGTNHHLVHTELRRYGRTLLNVAVLRGTLSYNLIEREDRSRYHKVPVQAFRCKAKVLLDVLFLVLDRCGVRGYPYQTVRITSRAKKQTLNQTRQNKTTEQYLIHSAIQTLPFRPRTRSSERRTTPPSRFAANSPHMLLT